MAVVLHHITSKFGAAHYFSDRMPQAFSWGRLGVDFFFVLSGFIIAETIRRAAEDSGRVTNFLRHRVLRIYPAFWLAFVPTLCVALFAARSLHSPITTDPLELLRAALLLPFPDGGAPVIGVAWTLHHEVLFYALATLTLAWPRLGVSLSILLLAGSLLPATEFPVSFLCSPLHWEFVMGIAVSFALHCQIRRIGALLSARYLRPIVLALLTVAMGAYTWHWRDQPVPDLVGVLCFAPLFTLLVANSVKLNLKAPQLLVALGDSSYTLYLWHVPIVTPLIKLAFKLLPDASAGTLLTLTFAIAGATVIAAHLIYLKLERPLVVALSSWFGKRNTHAPA